MRGQLLLEAARAARPAPCSRLQPLDGRRELGRRHRRAGGSVAARASRQSRKRARARPPHRNSTRVPPLNFSQPVTAMTPMPPVRATCVPPQADRSKSVTSMRRSVPGAARFLAQRQRRGFLGRDEPHLDRAVLPDDAIGLGPRRRRSRPASPAGAGRWSRSPRRDGSSRCAPGTPGRTPPTARAGRCAAACGRSAVPSPPRPRRGPRPRGGRRRTCTSRPSSWSTTSMTRRPPSVPRSCGCPPEVG